MQSNKIPPPKVRQSGFSLIELMVAIVLGLLITAAVTAMTVSNLKMNGDTLKSARLNQDLGAVMQIMVNDIRRAGYAGGATEFEPGPGQKKDISLESSCVLYAYNRADIDPDDPKIDDDEWYGFKLAGGNIQMRTSCTEANCPTDCSLGTWVALTDSDVIKITEFAINSENSKCHNINEGISIRSVTDKTSDVSPTKFACNETEKKHFEMWWEGDPAASIGWKTAHTDVKAPLRTYPESGYPILSVGIRHVNVSLEAELAKDPSVSKSLGVSIKVRNDHVYKIEEP